MNCDDEELKETLKCTQDSWFKDTQLIEKQQKELDLKDKVIDLMAKYIQNNVEIINSQIDDEICCHNIDGECINRKCIECVSKYFYKKVEKVGEKNET